MTRVDEFTPTGTDEGVDGFERFSAVTPRRSVPARVLVAAVHAYQAVRSGRPTGCRFLPTCSEYAIEAIDTHGTARGTALAAGRLTRCTPWGGHGIDPVPDRRAP